MPPTAPLQKEERVIFAAGAAEYSVRDVIDAAHFRAEIEPLWREHRRRVAADARATQSGAEVEGSAIDEAAIAFRYEYDLITAEETEAWLDARSLTLGEFSDYFARQYWGKIFSSRSDAPDLAFSAASAEQRELFAVDLILSGELDRMAMRLAWRIAARSAATDPADPATIQAERAKCASEIDFRALGREAAWCDEMAEIEALFRARCATLLRPEVMKREVSSLRLPLTRLEVETIEFDSQDAAREALLCVREDGLSMEEVAHEGRYPFRRSEVVLEAVPAEQQQKFLSLTPGSILDPVARGDGYVLSRLLAKHEPSIDDPQVQSRVEQRILQRHFAELVSGRIQWSLLPNVA